MLHMPMPMLLAVSGPIVGQQLVVSSGPFIVPDAITEICAAVMSPGSPGYDIYGDGTVFATGKAGNLRWVNAIAVTPGETLTRYMYSDSFGNSNAARLSRGSTILVAAGPSLNVGTGYNGGNGAAGAEPYDGPGAASWTADGPDAIETSGSFIGGRGTSPYGSTAPLVPATTLAGANYGGGGHNFSGGASLGFIYIVYGPGRSFPSSGLSPV